MKRKLILAAVLLSLVLMSGCGVSTSKYDAVVAERDATKAQLTSTNDELARTKEQLESTKNSLLEATYKADLLQQKMDRSKIIADLAAEYAPYTKGLVLAPSESTKLGLEFTPKLATLGDPQLESLFQAWIVSNFAKQATADLFDYVLGQALIRQLQ